MPEAVPATAREVPVTVYNRSASPTPQASPASSLTEAALLALKLAPDIILGAHLSGLKSGDTLQGQLLLRQQDKTLLLVTDRGVFAVSPKENLPTSGALALQISTVGRVLTAVAQTPAQQQNYSLTLIALPPAPQNPDVPLIVTPDDARQLAQNIAQDAPALESALRVLPEQSASLSVPVTRPQQPVIAAPVSTQPTAPTLVSLVASEDTTAPALLGTVIAIVDEDNAALLHTGPLAQLVAQSRAVLLRALPPIPGSADAFAELIQSGKLPLRVILPESLKLSGKSQAILLLSRSADSQPGITEKIESVLARVPPEIAAAVRERLPTPGTKLASQLALFAHLTSQTVSPDLLPPSKDRAILLETFAALRSQEQTSDSSTKITLPLRVHGEPVPIQFVLYHPEEAGADQHNSRAGGSRDHLFDINVTFPGIGAVQLSGIYHAAHLSLTVTTDTALPQNLQTDLSAVYAAALTQDDWSGTLRFKNKLI